MSAPRPRVLLVAPDCNPDWHSLPALVANYYGALREVADLTLATQIRNEAGLAKLVRPSDEVVYLDTERVERPIFQLAEALTGQGGRAMTLKTALRIPSHLYFEHRVWDRFGPEVKGGRFDLIHRASPMSPTIPSPIASWSPVPFVIGPVLGGLRWPQAYRQEMRRESEWLNYLRSPHRFLPYYKATYGKAAAILAAYRHTVEDIPAADQERVIDFSEGGIHAKDFPERTHASFDRATILFVGRLVPFKQPDLLVEAFAGSERLRQHRLVIVGDGVEMPRLQSMVEEQGLKDSVELTGSLPFKKVIELMYQAQVFAFPSVREQGGGVLTLASMASTPSVVVDYGGPAYRVGADRGIKVPLGDRASLVRAFRSALESLVHDPARIEALGVKAREFTQRHYDWSNKATKTADIYDWVLGRRPEKPSFW